MEPRSSTRPAPQSEPEPSSILLARDESPGEILVADARWRGGVPNLERRVRRAVMLACAELWIPAPTVLLERDHTVKRLNYDFRGKNKPTNVLTFDGAPGFGGDIVLGFETVRRESRQNGCKLADHLTHLLVHGILHLAGYDHHEAGEARQMEMYETRILSRLGVANPWGIRQGGMS